ncbi:3-isopropylmalate dehydratase small subunit [Noviherbaspirillum sp. CPCC 100848]|uniref:3-isopropylmalate dehydratase small subunit n=1 Tax=Noviherbaspirillum album TaxID=3080276 RepID=A0ABU6J8F3_9BURK|nr:3-isopropylmalate dehydratase small subunit [Noviherbaspirillum sp. CPCC 100848]MEC4719919.1 3-isopropylmalate dehydratase small subunit [Noviherbaspirillum sp. CPCC 100848]
MDKNTIIEGIAAPLPIANLDTDQIMPKQFLRGIDKAGLDRGVLYDLRFDEHGSPRKDFILNQPAYARAPVILGGANFGCGSSREHAVWGLQQFGVRAIIASSFGEIFYSNAMNNGLLLATVSEDDLRRLLEEASSSASPMQVRIDVENLQLSSATVRAGFSLSGRHRQMFMNGLDMLGASLLHLPAIKAFASRWQEANPWLKDVASAARARIDRLPEVH